MKKLLASVCVAVLLPWSAVAADCSSLTDQLILHYSMEDASGNATDASGNGNTGVETGGTIDSIAGKVNNARDFEAVDTEWFEVADSAGISTGDIDFSWSAWVWKESTGTFPMIVQKGSGSAATLEYSMYHDTGTNRLIFSTANGSAAVTVSANNFGAVPNTTWMFVVGWHDAAGNVIGISVNDGTPNTSADNGGNDSTSVLQIGASSGQSIYWDGIGDEVTFRKCKITAAQITTLYNGGAGLAYPWSGGGATVVPSQTLLGVGAP
jgi:hypothetical protein